MNLSTRKTRISCAIAAAIAGSTANLSYGMLEEVVVTATKRAESAQDIPVAIQAIGQESLEDLGIGNFKDYIKVLPGVNSGGRGPGRNEIFIRGVSVGKGGLKIAGAIGTEPNVALYLDEAPISLGGRNIDAYMTDMNRVEVLPGPQGTLFGASSQAGTVRLITNKPDMEGFSGGLETSYTTTNGGDDGYSMEAYFNLPIIDDVLAARFAIFNVTEGGYIDNVPGTKQITTANPALTVLPTTRGVADNFSFAEDNHNEVTYSGIRAAVKFTPNDDWEVLLQHFHQEIDKEGVWDYDPALGELQSQTFTPDEGEDVFDLSSWTVNGRVAGLEMVYTGSFLRRTVEEIADYSGYADAGPFIPYYICEPGYDVCGAPDLFLDQYVKFERTTHEFRVSTDADQRIRGIVGVFADDTDTVERGDWTYPATVDRGFPLNDPITGSTASNPDTRGPGVTFFNDFTRGKKELSFFGELAYDLTDSLTASIGARRYDLELSLRGSSNFNFRVPGDFGRNVDEILQGVSPADFQDTILKFNLKWQINDDMMVYGTWSEGYRPGGFNRNGGASLVPDTPPFVPDFFESDELTNMEFGWKTAWLDGTLRWNGSIYFLEWEEMQVITLDFDVSNLAFISNAADAEIKGLETDVVWAATDNLTLFANVSYNDGELTRVPANVVSIAPEGSELALAPELQYVIRARYEWETSGGSPFAQLTYAYTDDMISSINVGALFVQDSYSTLDATLGYSRDDWTITLFANNLTDELADLFISNEDDIIKTTPNRPRSIGLRFSYDF